MKSLAEQMAVYAAYHRHPMNKAIHFVGIPVIVWSLMVFLSMTPSVSVGGAEFTAAHIAVALLLAYYVLLDFALGVAAVVLFTMLLVTAIQVEAMPGAVPWVAAGGAFVGGWVVQFIGHGVWEKRRPALMDNLFQVFVAPIFLVAEIAFGLRLKKTLKDRVEQLMVHHLPGQ